MDGRQAPARRRGAEALILLPPARNNQTLRNIDRLPFENPPFETHDEQRAAEVRAYLQRLGTPISPIDTPVAGQALARDLTLVTRNTREFLRVPDLRVENWES
jgi:tRNA(fMet)-specific endonuclease VapC